MTHATSLSTKHDIVVVENTNPFLTSHPTAHHTSSIHHVKPNHVLRTWLGFKWWVWHKFTPPWATANWWLLRFWCLFASYWNAPFARLTVNTSKSWTKNASESISVASSDDLDKSPVQPRGARTNVNLWRVVFISISFLFSFYLPLKCWSVKDHQNRLGWRGCFSPMILEIPSKQFGQTQAFDPTPPHPKWSSPPNNQKMPNARTVYALLPCARITERPGNLGRALKDAPALPLWCFKNYLVPKEKKQKRNTFTKNQTLTAKGRSTLHIMPIVKEKKQKNRNNCRLPF